MHPEQTHIQRPHLPNHQIRKGVNAPETSCALVPIIRDAIERRRNGGLRWTVPEENPREKSDSRRASLLCEARRLLGASFIDRAFGLRGLPLHTLGHSCCAAAALGINGLCGPRRAVHCIRLMNLPHVSLVVLRAQDVFSICAVNRERSL